MIVSFMLPLRWNVTWSVPVVCAVDDQSCAIAVT
jgi:hypothetical protein